MMKDNAALRVAITGANGNIGRKLIAALLAAPEIAAIHAIDRDLAGLPPHDARLFLIQADLRGPGLFDALAGIDAVIHLAAQNPYPDASWEDASASFDMTAKLSEACAKASVSRLVFASSNHVMGGYKDTPVALSDGGLSTDLPPRVGTLVKTSEGLIDSTAYAAAKLMGERALTVKAETGAFTAVLLRIGWCQPGENCSANDQRRRHPEVQPGRNRSGARARPALVQSHVALERRSRPRRFRSPPRRRLYMAVPGHRRERDVRELAFALGLVGWPQADRLSAARRRIEPCGSGPVLRPAPTRSLNYQHITMDYLGAGEGNRTLV